MSQLANNVAEPGVDFDSFCGSIAHILPFQHFAEGANLKWQK